MAENTQIYSATYSNVPVFEFVTSEGPIMRRKSDSWINATHILKIAKFPKAKRTRILEKDVQTGTHEKVQGGYGKYQGTYVPLNIGADIAKNFGVFEELRPIFEFEYIEGKSETPPPAPKHSHASASNVARRQASSNNSHGLDVDSVARRMRSMPSRSSAGISTGSGRVNAADQNEAPKKRGRPKRYAQPELERSDTAPLSNELSQTELNNSFGSGRPIKRPNLSRQDTEKDALQIMVSNLGVNQDDLEYVDKSTDEENENEVVHDDHDELMTGKELFGTPRSAFERSVQYKMHNYDNNHSQISAASMSDPYGLQQYHLSTFQSQSPIAKEDIYSEYFNMLLNYFLEEGNSKDQLNQEITSEEILNPPTPLSKINITQPIDGDGNTLFHWACSMANIPVIRFLLKTFKRFLRSDIKNNNGETPLMFLVKFSNSFQLKNFHTILEFLGNSIFNVDNGGKSVLHHIALAANSLSTESTNANDIQGMKKNKEKYAKYYLETIINKLLKSSHSANKESSNDKEEESNKEQNPLTKLLNHQDSDGNTAFHIFAYHLNKKCIRLLINYHKYINFQLTNLVGYTAENYLASHNHVLRLDNTDRQNNGRIESSNKISPSDMLLASNNSDLQNHLNATRKISRSNVDATSIMSEKFVELTYDMDKELARMDRSILEHFKLVKSANYEKLLSQKSVLQMFRLDYLIENIEAEYNSNASNNDYLILDKTKDKIIQDEIGRLVNDLCFQNLHTKADLFQEISKYTKMLDSYTLLCIKKDLHSKPDAKPEMKPKEPVTNSHTDTDTFATIANTSLSLASYLQELIMKKRALTRKLVDLQCTVSSQIGKKFSIVDQNSKNDSLMTRNLGDSQFNQNRENKENIMEEDTDRTNIGSERLVSSKEMSVINQYPPDNVLYKYCKLIALCCGMDFEEVENSIDFIEQSLSKTGKTQ